MSDSLISGQPLYLLYSNLKAFAAVIAGHWQSADHQRFALASAGGATLKCEWQGGRRRTLQEFSSTWDMRAH
jgi:hypothetical protein